MDNEISTAISSCILNYDLETTWMQMCGSVYYKSPVLSLPKSVLRSGPDSCIFYKPFWDLHPNTRGTMERACNQREQSCYCMA